MRFYRRISILFIVAAAFVSFDSSVAAAQTLPVDELAGKTHFHGIAVDREEPSRLLLATHHGFFRVTADGMATRISVDRNDYMGFTPHPAEENVHFASGHPVGGGNTGFLVSEDGGRTWTQRSEGARGPVDFHQMDVSRSDPQVIYGVYGGLQVSENGGRTWKIRGDVPPKLFDLTVSGKDANRLYAATRGGLLLSEDGGRSWKSAHHDRSPATMVQSTASGRVYAFIAGLGLVRTAEGLPQWEIVSQRFNDRYLLHLAADPSIPDRLFVITSNGEIFGSDDGGGSWRKPGSS